MAVTVADIEDGLLAAIGADTALHGYLRTLESYGGHLESDLAHIPWHFPAVFVLFAGATYKPLTQFEEEADFTFSLLCVAQTLRGNKPARRGDGAAVGTYTILNDLRKLLVGNTLGLSDVLPMWLHQETAVLNSKAMSVYDAKYIMHGAIILQGS
jgi:phage gp37-like protein